MGDNRNLKYYAVHVDAESRLRGIHYVPFSDEQIAKLKQDYEDDMDKYGASDFVLLGDIMAQYLLDKFPYDWHPDTEFSAWMNGFEPVDMNSILRTPQQPREVDVEIHVGDDDSFHLSIGNAQEKIEHEENKLDYSWIESRNDEETCSIRIQIHRHNSDYPHLNKCLYIDCVGFPMWDVKGRIESIEQDDNITTYHCRNSLFPFTVIVTWHMLYFYNNYTPIYKE